MICQYPHVQGITGYRRGCRCRRCTQAQAQRNHEYRPIKKANECFEGGMSQASIDQWAQEIVATMRPSERRLLAELDI